MNSFDMQIHPEELEELYLMQQEYQRQTEHLKNLILKLLKYRNQNKYLTFLEKTKNVYNDNKDFLIDFEIHSYFDFIIFIFNEEWR